MTDYQQATAWALVLARWVAAQIVIDRLAGYRKVAWIVAVIGLPIAAISLVLDPNWPWIGLAVVLLVLGGGAALLISIAIGLLRRLSLSRQAKPLAAILDTAKANLLAELAAAGAPVSVPTALRFVVSLARGKAPYRDVGVRLRDLVGNLDRVIDPKQLQAALNASH